MKLLDKIGLELFSGLVLILTVLIGATIFGWLDINILTSIIKGVINNNQTITNIVLGIDVVLMLLAIKCLFFNGLDNKDNKGTGVLLANEQGKLLITKETLENLAIGVVKEFNNIENLKNDAILAIENLNTKVEIDDNNDVIVNINIAVNQQVVIKELTVNLQNKIKQVIKDSSDLDVKEVNVIVKNVASKKEA